MGAAEHIQRPETWKRGGLMVLFAVIYLAAEVIVWGIAVFQFGHHLLTGETNPRLLDFGQRLSTYIYQILLFVTYRSDDRPYPYDDFPEGTP